LPITKTERFIYKILSLLSNHYAVKMKRKTSTKKPVKRAKIASKKAKIKASKTPKRAIKVQNKPIKKQKSIKKQVRTQKKTSKIQKKSTKSQKKIELDETPLGEMDSKEKEDFLYDEVTGGRNKKPVMSILNKAKLSKHEMDELFCDWC